MSAIRLYQYPVLTPILYKKSGYILDKSEFTYRNSEGIQKLKCESVEDTATAMTLFRVSDSHRRWHPDHDGLDISISGQLKNPSSLFGKSGILPSDHSRLGLAVIWTDKTSRVRGSQPVQSVPCSQTEPFQFSSVLHFEPGILRGILSLRIVLTVDENHSVSTEEGKFATARGTLLGVLDDLRIIIEGSGSVFPVAEVEEPGKPLWWLETNIEDPRNDRFDDEHLLLNLNTKHDNYPNLYLEDGVESALLKEIIASALFTLFMQVQSAEGGMEAIRKGKDAQAEPGSIALMLNYMADMNDWLNDIDIPQDLNRKIHEWAEKKE